MFCFELCSCAVQYRGFPDYSVWCCRPPFLCAVAAHRSHSALLGCSWSWTKSAKHLCFQAFLTCPYYNLIVDPPHDSSCFQTNYLQLSGSDARRPVCDASQNLRSGGNDVPTDGIIRKFFLAMPSQDWICLEVIWKENLRKIWIIFTKELEKSC